MINFVVESSDLWPHVLDTQVKGGVELSKISTWWRAGCAGRARQTGQASPSSKGLQGMSGGALTSHLLESSSQILGEAEDIESKCPVFSAFIEDPATHSCGRRVCGACQGGNP